MIDMKKFILPFLIISLGLSISACGGSTSTSLEPVSEPTTSEEAKTLTGITLSGNYKTEYYLDDVFDKRGLVVTAHYDDDSTKVVYDYTTSGFDSSEVGECTITVTYLGKTATYTVTVSEEVVITTNVTIKVNVSGISSYEGIAEKIYLNSTLLSSSWGTEVMTQDEENKDLWTLDIQDVEVGQSYNFNFYYGNSTDPNWTIGKNILEDGTGEYRSVLVEDDEETGSVSYTFDAEFDVPSLTNVDVDLVLDPIVQLTASDEGVAIKETTYVYAWIEGCGNNAVPFTKGEDGKWHYTVTVGVSTETGNGSLHYTAVLGTISAADWEKCQMGAWENGSWAKWENGYTISDITVETTSTTGPATFKEEPEVIDPNTAYNITFKVTVPNALVTEGLGLGLRTGDWAGTGSSQWVDDLTLEGDVFTYTYSSKTAAGKYSLEGWSAQGVSGNFYVGKDTSWNAFSITVSDMSVTAIVEITLSTEVLASNLIVGTVTNSSGCVIA